MRGGGERPDSGSSWRSLRPFRNSWAGLRTEWAATLRDALAQAGWILALGSAGCVGWSWCVSMLGQWLEPRGMGAWDQRLLEWAANERFIGFTGGVLLESPGNILYLAPLTLAVALWSAQRGQALAGAAVLVAYWGVRFLVGVGWSAWSRSRPDLIAEGIAAPGFHSFPSGHTAMATAAYGALSFLWIRASNSLAERLFVLALTSVWVLAVGAARVRLGAHWPSDILAGVAVALPWLGVVIWSLRAAEAGRRPPPRGQTLFERDLVR